jgi:hypothetical protein
MTLFVVSCSALMLEVALTRVFSFVLWYHLTYLVVGLALLGYGAAGTKLATKRTDSLVNYSRTIVLNCALFSLLTIVALIAAVRLPLKSDAIFEGNYYQILPIVLTHVLLALPFYFAGNAIGFVLMRNRERTNRLYSADLLGAGTGVLLAVVAINYVGAIAAIFLAAALPAGVALAGAWHDSSPVRIRVALLALLLVIGMLVSANHELIVLQPAPDKDLVNQGSPVAFTKWNILNRIDVTEANREHFFFGGVRSDAYTGPLPLIRIIYQDATAPTALVHIEGAPENSPVLGYFLQGAPYAIRKQPPSVLVLGFGGGIDGLIAEHAGAGHVVGVDINPITVDLVSHRYRDFSSSLFEKGNLQLVLSEARHYLTKSNEKFDVIQLSGVDTFAALSAGSFALSENYLYTSEAVRDLLNHLGPNGVLSYSRWLFRPPREALRLVVTIREALRLAGIQDARTHIVVVSGGPPQEEWADTLVKNTAFTPEEVLALHAWADERHFQVLYDPFRSQPNIFDQYLKASDAGQQSIIDSYVYDITPSRDDKPFFFQFYRWSNIWHPLDVKGVGGYSSGTMPKGILSLLIALGEMFFFSLIFILVPLAAHKGTRWPAGQAASWLAIFAALGLGYITVEMVLIQKFSIFLGGPAYSMAVTLFALLAFSGVGSRFSEKLSESSFRAIGGMVAALLAVQGLELAFLDWGIPHLLGLPQIGRCTVAIAAIAPLGLLMGMPFPTLLAKVGLAAEALIPWGWGVNACATVLGSVLATIANMVLGLNYTWLLAMGTYALVLSLLVGRRQVKPIAHGQHVSETAEIVEPAMSS